MIRSRILEKAKACNHGQSGVWQSGKRNTVRCNVDFIFHSFARYKGELEVQVRGAKALDHLKNGDKVLICEGCTHHRQCGDIGTEKLPNWIRKHTGQEIEFHFTSGTEFPMDLSEYRMIIHCGGCMLNEREMKYRIACAQDAGIPITNYGVAIAYMNGILKRSVEVFPEIWKTL